MLAANLQCVRVANESRALERLRRVVNVNISTSITRAIILLLILSSFCCRHQRNSSAQTSKQEGGRTTAGTDAGRSPEGEHTYIMPTADSPYIKVYVTNSGEITLDGKVSTLEETGSAFSALAQSNGVVVYTRDAPDRYGPHPNATKVLNLVIEHRLNARICSNKDFSDAIGPDGKLLLGQ